jgi:hypothetical protein
MKNIFKTKVTAQRAKGMESADGKNTTIIELSFITIIRRVARIPILGRLTLAVLLAAGLYITLRYIASV